MTKHCFECFNHALLSFARKRLARPISKLLPPDQTNDSIEIRQNIEIIYRKSVNILNRHVFVQTIVSILNILFWLFVTSILTMCQLLRSSYREVTVNGTFLPRDAMRNAVSAVFAVARCLSVCPSVRLSVRHVGVLYPDGGRYRQTFCSAE